MSCINPEKQFCASQNKEVDRIMFQILASDTSAVTYEDDYLASISSNVKLVNKI